MAKKKRGKSVSSPGRKAAGRKVAGRGAARKSGGAAGSGAARKSPAKKAAAKRSSKAGPRKKAKQSNKSSGPAPSGRPLLVETGRYLPPSPPSRPRRDKGSERPARLDEEGVDTADDDLDDFEAENANEKYMSVGDHLEEFRRRLFGILGVVIVCAVGAAFFTEPIHAYLTAPYSELTGLQFFLRKVYGPLEAIIKLALMVGFSFSLPLSLFILWGFVTPALSRKNAWIGYATIGASCFLFWTGMAVSWTYIFPISLEFMFSSVLPLLSGTEARITIEDYYGFLFMVIAGGGLIFQLPLVIVVTGAIGVFPLRWHKQAYRYVIVGIFVVAAVLTPPDWLSQVIMAGILLVLYVVSLLIVWIIERARRIR